MSDLILVNLLEVRRQADLFPQSRSPANVQLATDLILVDRN